MRRTDGGGTLTRPLMCTTNRHGTLQAPCPPQLPPLPHLEQLLSAHFAAAGCQVQPVLLVEHPGLQLLCGRGHLGPHAGQEAHGITGGQQVNAAGSIQAGATRGGRGQAHQAAAVQGGDGGLQSRMV